jgi:hypothetical protein
VATVVSPAAPSSGKQATVGVALSATELCVVRAPGSGASAGARRFSLQALNGDGMGWPALTAALRELSRTLGVDGGRLNVALMPPLTEIRRLDLPPMGDDDLRMHISRNAARYFVGARSAQVVGTSTVARMPSVPAGGVMAAAAPQRLVAALHTSAREAGWTVESVSPAEGAWCAAAAALWPATSRQAFHLLVCGNDRTELLQIEQGRLSGVRRFRAGAADAALVAEAIAQSPGARNAGAHGRVNLIGVTAPRQELARALSSGGLTVSAAPPEWAEGADHPDLLAAEFAGPNAAPLLRSEVTVAAQREMTRRTITRMAIASVVLLLVAALFSLWGAKRQLRVVRAERELIRPQISATLVGRSSVETAFRQLTALSTAQRSATRWTAVIAGVSEHLDKDAYLTAMRGRDDSLLVEGIGVRAATAFNSLAGTPGLASVHAAAPVRRESPDGGPALERFTIAAAIVPPRALAPAPTPATPPRKAAP